MTLIIRAATAIRDMLSNWLADLPVSDAELGDHVNRLDDLRRNRFAPHWQRNEADSLMCLLEGELRDRSAA